MMLKDLRLLLWLNLRHLRTRLITLLHETGSDFLKDKSVGDRIYQFYILGILAVAITLSLMGFLNLLYQEFLTKEVHVIESVLCGSFFIPLIVFAVFAVRHLWVSPIKINLADIAHIASSPLKSSAIVCASLINAIGITLGAGFVLSYILAWGATGVLEYSLSPFTFALNCALVLVCSVLSAWIVGIIRLSAPRLNRIIFVVTTLVIVASICAGFTELLFQSTVFASLNTMLAAPAPMGELMVVALIVATLEIVVIISISKKIDIPMLIDENALYAELQSFSLIQQFDPQRYNILRRQKRLAKRGPLFFLSLGTGRKAYLSRALLSHLRQFEGIPSLVAMGSTVIPLGVLAALKILDPVFFLVWIVLLLTFQGGVFELTRIFKEDVDNETIRNHLPLGTLELLVLDSLPACIVVMLSGITTLTIMLFSSPLLPSALLLAVIFGMALVLCSSLERARPAFAKKAPGYEISILMFACFTCALSFTGSAFIAVLGTGLYVVVLTLLISQAAE